MAIVISGVNNNDKITATDGVIDSISGFNLAGIITASSFTGDLTGDVTGNISGNNGVFGDFVNVGSNIQIGQAGILTATTFVGNLTGNVNATSNLLLQIGGSEKFRVASSGQLGIGGANYGTSGQVLTSGGSSSAATWSTINSDAINEGNTKAEVIDSGSDGRFIVETEGSERLRIDSSGRIIQNYAALPSVSSNLPYAYFAPTKQNYGGVDLTMNLHDDASNALGNGGGIGFSANSASDSPIVRAAIRGNTEATNSTAGYLSFFTRPASGNNTERVRIASDGNVSVGNIHTAKKIHISTTGNQKILIDPNYNNNSGGSSNSEANANNIVESILIRTSFGDNAASQTNAGHKWGIKFQGYNGNDFTQAISKCAGVFAVSEDEAGGYNRNVGLAFHTSPYNTAHREVMRINTNGIVTKPYQPSFHVSRRAGDVSANNYITFDQVFHNNGSHYDNSNGRFTAPVTGVYYFSAWNYTGGTSAFQLRINRSVYAEYTWDDTGGCGTWVCPMTAGQYAQIYTRYYGWRGTADYHNGFNGFLIG